MKEVIENNRLSSIYLFENKKCKTKRDQRGKWNAQTEIIHSSKGSWINQIVNSIMCLWIFFGRLTLLWKKKQYSGGQKLWNIMNDSEKFSRDSKA